MERTSSSMTTKSVGAQRGTGEMTRVPKRSERHFVPHGSEYREKVTVEQP